MFKSIPGAELQPFPAHVRENTTASLLWERDRGRINTARSRQRCPCRGLCCLSLWLLSWWVLHPSSEGETWRRTKPCGCWRTCTSRRRRDHRWVLFSLLMAISTFTTTSNNYLLSTAPPYTYCMPSDCAGTLGYLYHTGSV